MKKIILTKNGQDMLASDGLMKVDGRYGLQSIRLEVHKRNLRMAHNFPHKVCDGFYIVDERLNKISEIFYL